MLYCENCRRLFEGKRCPVCKSGRGRRPEPEDVCLLAEKGKVWGQMLANALRQKGIRVLERPVLGAALAMRTAPQRERLRLYVSYEHLQEARDILDGMFSEE